MLRLRTLLLPAPLSALWLWLVAALVANPIALAQTTYPAGESLISANPLTAWRLNGPNAQATAVTVNGPGFTQAWRIETTADTSPSWAIEWRTPVTRPVARNDVALLRFMARAISTSDESGAALVRLVVQKAAPDYDKSAQGTHSLSSEWKEFFIPFAFSADYAAQAAEVVFGFGFKRQAVEIGGFDFVYYGKSVALNSLPRTRPSYIGREAGAAWRTAALARIERVRKSDVSILVVDANGKPVPQASVRIAQTRSAFQFGSALQFSRIASDSATNRIYRQKVLELFNAGTAENDLKWPFWLGERGSSYNRPQTLRALEWMKQHGLHTRGHVLLWPSWRHLPDAISALRGTNRQAEIPALARAHIADIVGTTRELVDEWDVLNEPYANHDLMDVFGNAIQVDWYHAARAAHPTAPLYLNDYSNHDASLDPIHVTHFENTAKYLLAQGAPLGGLGLQAHISASPSPPANVVALLDRYAALGLPVRITEFDINTDDEELQADYTRDFLTAIFSHPIVAGFQLWGFWENAHWIPQAAMYRADWSEKPNARAYKSLVLDEWRTRATGTTDATGQWRGRGFHGDYTVTVEADGRTIEHVFSLRSDTPDTRVRLMLAPPRLVNLSTRAPAGTGDATLIPGFFVDGTAPKQVLIRGIGPGLSAFNLEGALGRLELTLRDGQGAALASNRGWDTATAATTNALIDAANRTGAFALNRGSGDCALLATLAPGAYTVPVTPLDSSAGIALVEVYELDAAEPGRLRNLSTRARVGPGEQIAIPGFVLAGESARTLLVRAVGPGLAAFGVTGALAQPELVLRRGAQALAANAGWEASANATELASATNRSGAFSLQRGQLDAALLITLPAGAYTIQVGGAHGGSGVVLIEVYDVTS